MPIAKPKPNDTNSKNVSTQVSNPLEAKNDTVKSYVQCRIPLKAKKATALGPAPLGAPRGPYRPPLKEEI